MSETPESSVAEATPSPPARPRKGWGLWLRLCAVATVPLLLLGVTGVLLTRSLAIGGMDLSAPEFQTYLLGALLLAGLLGVLLATWLHAGLRSRLLALRRALAEERTGEIRALEMEGGWGHFADVAREASELLSRSHDAKGDARSLTELREMLDALVAGLEEWAATESSRGLVFDEKLGPLAAALESLRVRLGEREAEAHGATEATLETAREGRAAVELAVREAKKSALEASFLKKDLSALRLELRELERATPSGSEAPALSAHLEADAASRETGLAALSALRERLEEEERRALSLALVLAASRLRTWGAELGGREGSATHPKQAPPGSLVGVLSSAAGGLREIALACRSLAEEVRGLESSWERGSTAPSARRAADSPAPGPARTPAGDDSVPSRLAIVEQRGERLVALCERVERHAAQAVLGARAVEEDLGGLASRFEGPAAPNHPREGNPSGGGETGSGRKLAGPLRLLTRDDVVTEDEGEEAAAPAGEPNASPGPKGKPSGGARGDA